MTGATGVSADGEVAALAASRAPFLIGVRHHSPALAVAVPRLLDGFGPDVLAVELPAQARAWVDWLAHPETVAPVALAFSRGEGMSFYPFADFSPELAALRWARGAGVEVARVQVLQDPPDRRLRWQGPPLLQAQGPQVGRFQVGGVLPYRRQAPASRQYPRHGQAQDRGQGVANPAPVPRIGHALQDLPQGLARGGGCGG